jgi:uncharacterized membrane protein YqjE
MSDPASGAPNESAAPAPGAATGLFRSLTNLFATLVTLAQTRLELLTTELQEEVQRVAGLIIWAFVALLAGMIGLILGGLTIVFVYWDTHRVLAALLVTASFFVFALVAVLVLVAKMNSRPRFLDATLTELARDSKSLANRVGD